MVPNTLSGSLVSKVIAVDADWTEHLAVISWLFRWGFVRDEIPDLFDGAVAIPSAYLPPNYADVDGTGTLRSTYNYDAYMTTGSLTSDFKFVTSYNDNFWQNSEIEPSWQQWLSWLYWQ